MRWSARSTFVLIFLSTLCASAQPADNPPFTLTIFGPVIRGNDISVEAELKNTSDRTVEVVWGMTYEVIFHDAAGKLVPKKPGEWAYFGQAVGNPLQPGQSSGQKVFISGPHSEYDLSKPGKYIVYLRRGLNDPGYKGTVVASNKLTITILPKK